MVINIDGVRIDLCKVDLYTMDCRGLPCVTLYFSGAKEVEFTCATEEEAEQLIRFLDNCTGASIYTGKANADVFCRRRED